jgi:thiol-disulfide isomerase/thioredoxin
MIRPNVSTAKRVWWYDAALAEGTPRMLKTNSSSTPRTTPFRKIARHGLLFGFGMLCLLIMFAAAPVTTGQVDYVWDFQLNDGRVLLRRSEFEEALKKFKLANQTLGKRCADETFGKTCAESFNLMAEAYIGLESYKQAVESSDRALALARDDKQLALQAYTNKGLALRLWAEKKEQKKLHAAESAFRQALAIEGATPMLRYHLGVVLLQLNRDPEGVAELQQYIKDDPDGSFVENAKKMAANPRRAREDFAPEFSFTSLDGKQISLEDLAGKVVMLDFWATWCGPCVESVPDLRNLHKKYANDPSFVLLGISSDRDDEMWREFTEKHKMIWPQYRDKDRRLQRAFAISAFPTYIIIDHEGIVRHRTVGLSWSGASGLDGAIKKQLKLVPKSTASNSNAR